MTQFLPSRRIPVHVCACVDMCVFKCTCAHIQSWDLQLCKSASEAHILTWIFIASPSTHQSSVGHGTELLARSERAFLALNFPAGSPCYSTSWSLGFLTDETKGLEQIAFSSRILWLHFTVHLLYSGTFMASHLISFFHWILGGTGVILDLQMKKLSQRCWVTCPMSLKECQSQD